MFTLSIKFLKLIVSARFNIPIFKVIKTCNGWKSKHKYLTARFTREIKYAENTPLLLNLKLISLADFGHGK